MWNVKRLMVLASICSLLLVTGCAGFSVAEFGGGGRGLPGGVSHGVIMGDVTYPCFINSNTEFKLDSKDFQILKSVSAEATSTNVLGIFGVGDNGFIALYQQAQKIGADDVINVKADTRTLSILGGFYTKATTKLAGTAIRWKKKR